MGERWGSVWLVEMVWVRDGESVVGVGESVVGMGERWGEGRCVGERWGRVEMCG